MTNTSQTPLVSVLMPVFTNSSYFQLALKSVLLQTYVNLEIIIRDHTPTNEVQHLVEKEYLPFSAKIKYIRNHQPLPRLQVLQQLFNDSQGEFINYLMEEDLFYPTKIERMVDYFLNDAAGSIKLVTSYRQPIDEVGKAIPDLTFTKRRHLHDVIIDGRAFGDSMIVESNWVGEPSTVLFRKCDLVEPFGQFGGYEFESAFDMGSWMTLLSQGKGVYIADTLSFVRIYPQRNHWRTRMGPIKDWMHLISYSQSLGFLKNPSLLHKNVIDFHQYIDSILEDQQNPPSLDEVNYLLQCKKSLES
ncbi:glycosyltransferase involved in cell wall biosynthesis [Oikeobacillus pervagus]|uniref:Glycosyltransferase involved in cell wall biosynthesis n=1 Tax=Oikeobacillus pervagus TaxID=1325931 RepID=A0AAJ1WK59_9BACI|nr:glycosyltransferase [Oikeobacillus pervagus]MDQ0216405.1 glycosyltransferase involved in cell wall biosynthesis [Oikeobacillus pervagus]